MRCGGRDWRCEEDILDVWFDSGVSFAAVLEKNPALSMPSHMYLEGSDQHRGWFHSSLLASVGTRGVAPYKSVLTHGFVVDQNGEKMSKSRGNVILPEKIIKRFGAEILRLWVAAEDYRGDIRISFEILERLTEAYRKIRNTFRYLLGNIYDFDFAHDPVPHEKLEEIDRWILYRLGVLCKRVLKAYEDYEFHIVYHDLQRFFVVDLSSIYLDVQKDVLYTFPAKSQERRSAQTAIYIILNWLTRLLAPILTFTADDVWQYMPGERLKLESVHVTRFPEPKFIDERLSEKWERVLKVRDELLKALEVSRKAKFIGSSLEAGVRIYAEGDIKSFIEENLELFKLLAVVSHMEVASEPLKNNSNVFQSTDIRITIEIQKAPGEKCGRCWNYRTTVGVSPEHPTICYRCVEHLKKY